LNNLFKVLNVALAEDIHLNARKWGNDEPVVAPPFPGGSEVSVLNSRSNLSVACAYFCEAIVGRSKPAVLAGLAGASEGGAVADDAADAAGGAHDDDVVRQINRTAEARLKILELRHKHNSNRLRARCAAAKELVPAFNDNVSSSIDSVRIKDQLYRRKLRLQAEIANRRLQELLFECLGEISKACRRAALLGKKLCENVDAQKAHSTMSTQWEEFAMKLNDSTVGSNDKSTLSEFVPVEKFKYPKEFKAWESECADVITASKLIEPLKQQTTKIKMRRVLYLYGKRPKSAKDSRRRVTKLYQSRGGVRGLLRQIMDEYGLKQSADRSGAYKDGIQDPTVRMPLYMAPMPVTSKSITWLLPADASYFNSRVYYCIEERLLKQYELYFQKAKTPGDAAGQAAMAAMAAKSSTAGGEGKRAGGADVSPAVLARVTASIGRFLASTYVPGAREDPESLKDSASGFHTSWKPQDWLRRVLKQLKAQGIDRPSGKKIKRSKKLFCTVASVEGGHRRQSHISALDSVPSSSFIGSSLQSGSESYEEAMLTQQFMNSLPDVLAVGFTDVEVDATGSSAAEAKDGEESSESSSDDDRMEAVKGRYGAKRKARATHTVHFAPASVMHVLETTVFGEVSRLLTAAHRDRLYAHYPEALLLKNGLSNLYILQEDTRPGRAKKLPRTDSAARDRGSPLNGAVLTPLTRPAMQELVGVYAARRLDQPGVTTSPDAVSVYREDEKGVINDIVDNDSLKLQYFVLHRPLTRGKSVEEKHKAKKGHGLITQYTGLVEHDRHKAALTMSQGRQSVRQSGNTLAQEKARIKQEEEKARLLEEKNMPVPIAALLGVELIDESSPVVGPNSSGVTFAPEIESVSGTTVGGFCRWRGCICPGKKSTTGKNSNKYILCSLHQTLRLFLEGSGAKDELSRHLPSNKKSKSSKSSNGSKVAAEFVKITASSALLQELSGGKLAATIRAFCRRAAADAKSKKDSKSKKGSDVAGGGEAATQQLEKTERKRKELVRDVTMSQKVFNSEKNVAEELRKICALGVFPADELSAIRDEYNVLNRERVALQQRKALRGKAKKGREAAYESGDGEEEGGSPEVRAPRTEGELELEFCKRKNEILLARRSQLERALAAGKVAAKEGTGSLPKSKAEERLQDAMKFSKTYVEGL
jgi:hypothetical protein